MSAFVDFGRKTQYSVKNAMGDTKTALPILKEHDQKWFAVSDYGECSGWVNQYFTCQKNGIVPILGMETFVNDYRFDGDEDVKKLGPDGERDLKVSGVDAEELDWSQIDFPVDVFARTLDGYYNVIAIHNDAQINGVAKRPRTSDWFLKSHGKGVVALFPTPYSEISSLVYDGETKRARERLEFYRSVFDDVYVEIPILEDPEYREINAGIIRFCKANDVPMVPVINTHYDQAEDGDAFQIFLRCGDIRGGMSYEVDYAPGMYMKTKEEVWDTFKKYHESDVFTEEVMMNLFMSLDALCFSFTTLDLDTSPKTPHFENSAEKLREHALAGFVKAGFDKKGDKYKERLEYELDNICRAGFADYFLLIEQMFDWHVNKMHRIGSVGRGCFAGCMKVRMADGSEKFMAEVEKGDMVLSGNGVPRKVLDVYRYEIHDEEMSFIGFDYRVIRCTKDHRIKAIRDGVETWVPACELHVGDELVRCDGDFDVVTEANVVESFKDEYVYDLNVDVDHNYVVEGIVVHNSAAGSLVLRCLGVTKIDPIEHNLLFERFLDASRLDDIVNKGGKVSGADFPDVDCFTMHTIVITEDGLKEIKDVKVGDRVLADDGTFQEVERIADYRNAPVVRVCYGGWYFDCTLNHRVLARRDGVVDYRYVSELRRGDELVVSDDEFLPVEEICQERIARMVRDLKVHDRHCFRVCGKAYNHVVDKDGGEWYLSDSELDYVENNGEKED